MGGLVTKRVDVAVGDDAEPAGLSVAELVAPVSTFVVVSEAPGITGGRVLVDVANKVSDEAGRDSVSAGGGPA